MGAPGIPKHCSTQFWPVISWPMSIRIWQSNYMYMVVCTANMLLLVGPISSLHYIQTWGSFQAIHRHINVSFFYTALNDTPKRWLQCLQNDMNSDSQFQFTLQTCSCNMRTNRLLPELFPKLGSFQIHRCEQVTSPAFNPTTKSLKNCWNTDCNLSSIKTTWILIHSFSYT